MVILDVPGSGPDPAAWLPVDKRCAVCFHVDDVHPSTSADAYEAGGDLGAGALGHVEWLLERHSRLHVTVATTPDWRETSPVPTRKVLARLPWLRDRVFLAPLLPPGTMRLDRHPDFVRYVAGLPRTELTLHGLHHVHRGLNVPAEFQNQTTAECLRMLEEGLSIFAAAGLPRPAGVIPPRYSTPPALLDAMAQAGFSYVASGRDIHTPVAASAVSGESGLRGVPLFRPSLLPQGLVHLPTNFQATSTVDRALQILDGGGLLSIKAHIIKDCLGYVALDGMDELYRNYLDTLFTLLHARYGESLWWTTMGAIADRVGGRGSAAGRQPSGAMSLPSVA
ncbi:MAG: DUF2334 domain-containing protein [Gemmatimonadetes bacterium]|nr:DUF2334 domain-containing protein [Gemmatimonadota bacterium]